MGSTMGLVGKNQRRRYKNKWTGGRHRGATLTLQLLSKHGEEDGEVDGAAGLLDHGLQLLVLHIQLA